MSSLSKAVLYIITFFGVAFLSASASAGFVEVGASASYRTSTITPTNYSQSESYTGSLGYYFNEATALEFSYTNGYAKSVTDETDTRSNYSVYGVDFILTIGAKDAFLRPYFKAGGAQIFKEIRYKQRGYDPITIRSCGIAPSAGAGFRLLLSQSIAIKVGAETWTSPINDTCLPESQSRETTYDNSYRGGISWMF